MKLKKISAVMLVMALAVPTLTTVPSVAGHAAETTAQTEKDTTAEKETKAAESDSKVDSKAAENAETKTPKYIFLFIGDGMSYPQIQATADYLGTTESKGEIESKALSFMNFPVAGTAQTYDSTSFAPDSASTATSISTGNKTYSGTINMDTTMTKKFEAISEKLKKQKDFKVGVVTTVNLNHATPAAFYAHQASRNSYYDIAKELTDSNFDYFAGGALLDPTGEKEDQKDAYKIAEEAGYKVIKTQEEAKKLKAEDGKALVIAEHLADADAMSYDLDAAKDELSLKDYVQKGIEVLDNDTGFFMMVEGGKIDWACHANDAGSAINDTEALSNSVEAAVEFYKKHPDDTLILVTGDHETGGLTIGYAGTDYDTYLTNLTNQKISYAKFDSDYVAKYKENKTDFKEVLKDIKANFGLMAKDDADATEDSKLVLTDYEYSRLEDAYKRTLETGTAKKDGMSQEEYILYGTYEPLSVTITHILNNKSGINFASYAHTGLPVPVYAQGAGQEKFEGYYDNTDIYKNLAQLTGVK